eukprot:SAG31_NODE_726_length_12541_cov_4.922922_1_plen_75_part_00
MGGSIDAAVEFIVIKQHSRKCDFELYSSTGYPGIRILNLVYRAKIISPADPSRPRLSEFTAVYTYTLPVGCVVF